MIRSAGFGLLYMINSPTKALPDHCAGSGPIRPIVRRSDFWLGHCLLIWLLGMMTMWFQLVPEAMADTSRTKADLEALSKVRVAAITAAQQPFTVLADKYRAALQKQKGVAQTSGNLEVVIAADAALVELNSGGGAVKPPRDANISRLRDIYYREHNDLVLRVQPKIFQAEKDYLNRLEKLMADRTKLGLIDDAKMVMEILDKFSKELKTPKATDLATPASGTYTPVPSPSGFILIPEGSFQMGDAFGEGSSSEQPVHKVIVSSFFLQARETTNAEWDTVRTWALANGYTDLRSSFGKDPDHPVEVVGWMDVVKWCNARSQKERLVPCYYTNEARTQVLKTNPNSSYLTNEQVLWTANGYRLPTEAEWEKAARGGITGARFPWGDAISHQRANYKSNTEYRAYDESATRGHHPLCDSGITTPVGSFAPNGYGLYDMTGNVSEWCWDRYNDDYYSSGENNNPRGINSGSGDRVIRGGAGDDYAWYGRVAARRDESKTRSGIGFRPARGR